MRVFKPMLVMSLLSVISLARSGAATAQECIPFPDVPKDHWAYAAVTRLKCQRIVKGSPEAQQAQRPNPPARKTGVKRIRTAQQAKR